MGKKSVGKKFRRQKFSSVKIIRHQSKNSTLITYGFFTDKVLLLFWSRGEYAQELTT